MGNHNMEGPARGKEEKIKGRVSVKQLGCAMRQATWTEEIVFLNDVNETSADSKTPVIPVKDKEKLRAKPNT